AAGSRNRRMHMRVAAVAMLVVLAGCGPRVRTTMIGQPSPAEGAEREIAVYSTKVPECAFEEVALITASGEAIINSMDGLLAALKSRARELGGHAIVGLTDHPRTKADGHTLSGTVV